MADLGTVFVRVKMDTSGFNQEADNVQRKTQQNAGALKGLQSNYALLAAKIGAVVVAFRRIVATLRESIQLYGRQIQAERRLQSALEVSGREVDRLYPKYIDLANEIQELTTVGDEAAIELLGLATSLDITEDKIEEAVKGAIGLNEAFGINTERAVRGIANAFQGNFSTLERYIPALRATNDESEKMAILQKTLGDSFEIAKGQAETAFGALQQYENAVGDLKEELGRIIVEGAEPFIRVLTSFASRTVEAIQEARRFQDLLKEWGEEGEVTQATVEELNDSIERARRELGSLQGLTTDDQQRAEELNEFIDAMERQIRTMRQVEAASARDAAVSRDRLEWEEKLAWAADQNAEAYERLNERKFERMTAEERRLEVLREEFRALGDLRNQLRDAGHDYSMIQVLINDINRETQELIASMGEQEEELVKLSEIATAPAWRDTLQAVRDEVNEREALTEALEKQQEMMAEVARTQEMINNIWSTYSVPILESFGEALSGVEQGWENLGRTAVMAIATVLQSLAREAAARGAMALASPFTRGQAPAWFAAATLASVGAGIVRGLATQITAAALGADFVTSGPQLLMVGDNPGGKERVTVEPLSSRNVHGPQGGPIHVTVKVAERTLIDTIQRASDNGKLLIEAR